jgi:hypothetical protein
MNGSDHFSWKVRGSLPKAIKVKTLNQVIPRSKVTIRTAASLTVYASRFRHQSNCVGRGMQSNTKLNTQARDFITN